MTLSDAIEFMEKAKNELDNLRLEAENKERWDFADCLVQYIEDIQAVIDTLSDEQSVEELSDEQNRLLNKGVRYE